jgi:hypothetical protein
LPVAIELGDVQVGSLRFNGSEQLKGLQLAAHWTEKGMQIDGKTAAGRSEPEFPGSCNRRQLAAQR